MKQELPPLPYDKSALEPHLSAETLEYHHDKHHRKYVDKLNQLIEGSDFASRSLEEIIRSAPPGPVFNNAAQIWNHTFYWHSMSPDGGGEPSGALARAIARKFGAFAAFTEEFEKQARGHFGSGWVWLVEDGAGSVSIEQTHDADNPLHHGGKALLACDVWEHAYYIDYRNARAKYLQAFWNVVNWPKAAERFGE